MTTEKFEVVIRDELDRISSLLVRKSSEYSVIEDKLITFKQAAKLQKCSEENALGGFLAKHIVSVYDMLKDPQAYTMERWEEKLGDCIAYCLLLKAILIENGTKYENKTN